MKLATPLAPSPLLDKIYNLSHADRVLFNMNTNATTTAAPRYDDVVEEGNNAMIANSSMRTDQIDDYDDYDDDESEYEEDYSSSEDDEDEEKGPPTGLSLLSPNSIEIRRAAQLLLLACPRL